MANNELTEAWKSLVATMKNAGFGIEVAVSVGTICKQDEHALVMKDYVEQNPNEDFDTYLDKAYEIAGEKRPIYIVKDGEVIVE